MIKRDDDEEKRQRDEIICDRDHFEYAAQVATDRCAALEKERDEWKARALQAEDILEERRRRDLLHSDAIMRAHTQKTIIYPGKEK